MTPADLRLTRRRLGLTQAEMAEALGMSIDRYGDLERGRQGRVTPIAEIPRLVALAVAAIEAGVAA